MKYYDDYETGESSFRKHKKFYHITYGSDRDQAHERKKYRAAIYIRAHFKTLMKDEDYKKAYYKLIDEFARENFYLINRKTLAIVSEEQREVENSLLDYEIADRGKKKIEKYKQDAIYMVDWVKEGKNLIVYKQPNTDD